MARPVMCGIAGAVAEAVDGDESREWTSVRP
jgi:hypothetical protein